ncbi:MAG: cysteine--tRNA ligase [Candidatus Aminicenantes bacterium]|nr:MAG: cysteine--tRNA ligase [Candidatus Aminicenantes bacterium]
MKRNNILDLVGKTPIVPMVRLNPHKNVKIYVKIESFNPGGSIKDRIALHMVETAEKSGSLTPGKIVLEATSGNTGIGLAMVCAVKGYRCMLVMPESASIERRKVMEAYGAQILLTPAKRATDGAIEEAYALAREHPERYFLTDQFNNEANWRIHYQATGPEIWEQTGGTVTDVVATLGTSGTAMGMSRYFAENHPQVKVTAVEPFLGHKLQGMKNMKESYKPGIFDKNLPYQIVNIQDEEAFECSRLLAKKEGVFVGMSAGAAMRAALDRAEKIEKGVIVAILPDGGERYLSTPLFSKIVEEKPAARKLRLYNTSTRKKEVFVPQSGNTVTFYACGPTAYEPSHLDHCRRFVFADLVHRCLASLGYEVRFYMNFTDLDDNTINGAEKAGKHLAEFTGEYIEAFKTDMEMLGVLKASGYPLASEHVDDMINIAHELIHKGYAYERHNSIYFDISKFPGYGKLSRVDPGKIQVGKTVDLDDYDKESPQDFTLLKRSTLNELKRGIFYQTDFGNVRPGWHIECAAMTLRHLGPTMDLHTSSRNLIFPHHENENAIARAVTGKPLAKYWIHSELVLVEGKKMSPALDNVVTFKDVLDRGYTPREVRFYLLSTHYRKTINFSERGLKTARKNLKRLDEFMGKLQCLSPDFPHPKVASFLSEMENCFFSALDNDLNVASALAAIFDFVKKVNPILAAGQLDRDQKVYILENLMRINNVLNVLQLEECPGAPEILQLIRLREEARKNKDWKRADQVRDELANKGIRVIDTPKGPVWKKVH